VKKQSITVRDLAVRLQLGKSTVARALAGDVRVAAETRERILDEARRLGYRSLPSLRRAMHDLRVAEPQARKHRLFWWAAEKELPEDRAIYEEARKAAALFGYELESIPGETELSLVRRRALALNASGIIAVFQDRRLQSVKEDWARWQDVPVVAVMRATLSGLPIPQVATHPVSVMRQAVFQAYTAGYRRPGLIINPAFDDVDGEYSGIWHALLFEFGLPTDGSLHPITNSGALCRWVQQQRIDCVCSFHARVLTLLREEEFQVPDQVGFIYLRASHGQRSDPMALIDDRAVALGKLAVTRMINLTEHAAGWEIERQGFSMLMSTWQAGPTVRQTGNGAAIRCREFPDKDEMKQCQTVPLDLGPYAERSFVKVPAWFGAEKLEGIQASDYWLSGIRFQIAGEANNPRFCLMKSARQVVSRTRLPEQVELAVDRRGVRELAILHACAYVGETNALATYTIDYEDGKTSFEIRAPQSVGQFGASGKQLDHVHVHDWWHGARAFENAQTRPVWVCKEASISIRANLYVYRWVNPHPEHLIRRCRIQANTDSFTLYGVLAITLIV